MKKTLFFLFLSAAIIVTGCNKEESTPATVIIQAAAPAELPDLDLQILTVTLKNSADGAVYTGHFDANGKIAFTVDQGRYTAITSYSGAFNINGVTSEFTLALNGVNGGPGNTVEIPLVVSTSGDIIIREFYFCGTKTAAGANYNKDNYFELYNNSDHDVYLDGLCFASVYPYNSKSSSNSWETNGLTFLPTGYSTIWQFPGKGTENKLAPGESRVLAQNVKDHTVDAPTSVNLSGAHWALYHEQYTQQSVPPTGTPILNRLTSGLGTAYLPSLTSPAIVIFYLPMGADAYVADEATYYQYEPGKSSTKYWHIRSEWIIDGVECREENANVIRRLPTSVDAGYTYVSNGSYANKSVSRKVKEVVNGRTVYQDTNNSSNDFTPDAALNPRTR